MRENESGVDGDESKQIFIQFDLSNANVDKSQNDMTELLQAFIQINFSYGLTIGFWVFVETSDKALSP